MGHPAEAAEPWDDEAAALLASLRARPRPRLAPEEAAGLAARHALEPKRLLRGLVPLAEERAHAPLSRYRAGAVARGRSGALYLGANLELPGAPIGATVHAEQAAAYQAFLGGERGLTHLAVGGPPCGLCRQFLLELEDAGSLRMILPAEETTLAALLPGPFTPTSLGVAEPWMARTSEAIAEPAGSLADLACAAARRSHAPYTGLREGVVLVDAADGLHVGSRIESAAFNPTLTAIGAALSAWNLARRPALVRALHAREPDAPLAPEEGTLQLLRALDGPRLEHVDLVPEVG